MSDPVDYYDVQAMIRDALSDARGEMLREIADLRDELQTTHSYFQQECDSLVRLVNSRTEHLA